jgi:hypothetical protein
LTTANLHYRIEICQILARLVERLQQQVIALEIERFKAAKQEASTS